MTNRRRRGPERVRVAPVLISIHAPREGSDPRPRPAAPFCPISIHAPREGSDCKNSQNFKLFLTTSRQFFQISPPNSDSISKNKVTCSRKTPRNLVRTCGDFPRTCASHLKHQHILRSIGCLYSKMLNLLFVAVPQVVKTQTVFFLIHDFT